VLSGFAARVMTTAMLDWRATLRVKAPPFTLCL